MGRLSAVRVGLSLLAGLLTVGCVGRTMDLGALPATQGPMVLSVDNQHSAPATVYLVIGPMRIRTITVAGSVHGEVTIPPEFSGLTARMVVWIPSESYVVTTPDFVLERGARLELSITSAPLLVARKHT